MDPSSIGNAPSSKRVRYGCKLCTEFKPSSRNFNAERHVWVQHVRDSHPDHSRAAYEPYMFKQHVKEHVAVIRPGAGEEFPESLSQAPEKQTDTSHESRIRFVDVGEPNPAYSTQYDQDMTVSPQERPKYYEQYAEYDRNPEREYYDPPVDEYYYRSHHQPPSPQVHQRTESRYIAIRQPATNMDNFKIYSSRSLPSSRLYEGRSLTAPSIPFSSTQFQRQQEAQKNPLYAMQHRGEIRSLQRPMEYDPDRPPLGRYVPGLPSQGPHTSYDRGDLYSRPPPWSEHERQRQIWTSSSEQAMHSSRASIQHQRMPEYNTAAAPRRNPEWHTVQRPMLPPPLQLAQLREPGMSRPPPYHSVSMEDFKSGAREYYRPHVDPRYSSMSAPPSKDSLMGQPSRFSPPPGSRPMQRDMPWRGSSYERFAMHKNTAPYDRDMRHNNIPSMVSPRSTISEPNMDRTGSFMSPVISSAMREHESTITQAGHHNPSFVSSSHMGQDSSDTTKSLPSSSRLFGEYSTSDSTLPLSEQSSNPSFTMVENSRVVSAMSSPQPRG